MEKGEREEWKLIHYLHRLLWQIQLAQLFKINFIKCSRMHTETKDYISAAKNCRVSNV